MNSRANFPYRELMSFCNTSEHRVPALELRVKQAGGKVSVIATVFFQFYGSTLLYGKLFYLQMSIQNYG